MVLKPYSTWAHGRTKADLVSDLRAELNRDIPGIILNFTQPIIDTVTESVTGSSADLAVIIGGPDLAELRRLATRTLSLIQQRSRCRQTLPSNRKRTNLDCAFRSTARALRVMD